MQNPGYLIMDLEQIIDSIRNRPYMDGIEREKIRIKVTEEIFTPTSLVIECLDLLEISSPGCFLDPTNTFLDNSCGDGQFLSEVLIRKLQNGISFDVALATIYGVDIMNDNVELCRTRLLCGREEFRKIVEKNIVCHDALDYDYSFNGSNNSTTEQNFSKLFG